jgi:hypothetical protein
MMNRMQDEVAFYRELERNDPKGVHEFGNRNNRLVCTGPRSTGARCGILVQ